MSTESFLSQKLQKFSLVDLACVKAVYFIFGLFIVSLYTTLSALSGWFYLCLVILCAMPLLIHLTSQPGPLLDKAHAYIKTNNPSNQVLLFLTQFFLALMISVLLPILVDIHWWAYVIIMILLAIKPLKTSWIW